MGLAEGWGVEGGMDGEEVQKGEPSHWLLARGQQSWTVMDMSVLSPHTGGHPVLQDPVPYHQLICVWGRESRWSPHAIPAAKFPVQGTFSA